MVGDVRDNNENGGGGLGGLSRVVLDDDNHNGVKNKEEREQLQQEDRQGQGQDVQLLLKKYIDETIVVPSPARRRVDCCGTSRSLYCPECYKCLVPSDCWPWNNSDTDDSDNNGNNETKDQVQQQHHQPIPIPIELPFSMDIILGRKERRTSSTGVHIMVLRRLMMSTMMSMSETEGEDQGKNSDDDTRSSPNSTSSAWWYWKNTRMIDLNRVDRTSNDDDHDHHDNDDTETTFVLFPSSNSIPISEVASKIKKLIVVDCKWSTSGGMKGMDVLRNVDGGKYSNFHHRYQFVHLDSPPSHSLFWRWHHFDGHGMLSTIEAIYYAILEAHDARNNTGRRRSKSSRSDSTSSAIDPTATTDISTSSTERKGTLTRTRTRTTREATLDIMWLFGLQRRLILQDRIRLEQQKSQKRQQNGPKSDGQDEGAMLQSQLEDTLLPWSEEAKAYQIRLRHRKDGADVHARQKREGRKYHEKKKQEEFETVYSSVKKDDDVKTQHPTKEKDKKNETLTAQQYNNRTEENTVVGLF